MIELKNLKIIFPTVYARILLKVFDQFCPISG